MSKATGPMLRIIVLKFLLVVLSLPVQADTNLSRALDFAFERDFQAAEAARRQISDPVGRDIVTWILLRAGQGTFQETEEFLERNADWPGLKLLRARQEANMPNRISVARVKRFFVDNTPQTAHGALIYAQALIASGDEAEGRAELIRAWRNLPMSQEMQNRYYTQFPDILRPHNEARLDEMLWQGRKTDAERMLPLVSSNWQTLARARLALRAEAPGVDALINAVPASLKDDPGLAYERFRWRLSKGRRASALEVLFERTGSAARLGKPEVWSRHRLNLARPLMREGKATEAYRIAAEHHLDDAQSASQLEWLAGYIALRKLNDANQAIQHFTDFEASVVTPISKGRAGYWLGRAYDAAGNRDQARAAYTRAGAFQTSFYGQLAAEHIGLAPDPRLAGGEIFPDWRQTSFAQGSVLRAAVLLHNAGELSLAERFMTHLAESLTREEIGALIEIALLLRNPHIAVMIGKRAAQAGHEVHKGYFAAPLELTIKGRSAPPELVLSIARRESEFDPSVISPAGARGVMQLMPATAQAMARATGQSMSLDRLLTDPLFNASLGVAYLDEMIARFGRSVVLVAAAYNAGPSRAERWRSELGDPTDPRVDVVDWIEHVPFTETRNYIMRVAESLAVYRARLAGSGQPLGLEAALRQR